MTDAELASLAHENPETLAEMILSETERQDDMPMTPDELRDSQQWVRRAEAALEASKGGTFAR